MKRYMRIAVVCLVMTLLVVSCGGMAASAAGTQTWMLNSNGQMSTQTVPSGSVTVGSNSNYVWITDVAAITDVTFASGGPWTILLSTDSNWEEKCSTEVGYWDGVSFVPFPQVQDTHSYVSGGGIKIIIKVEVQTADATVNAGDWLAVRVGNSDTTSHTVFCDGLSSLSSPSCDPGFPVPEGSTVLLFGVGLMGMAVIRAIVALRQRLFCW